MYLLSIFSVAGSSSELNTPDILPAPEESADIYLSEFLNPKHKPFKYEYDFGDSWLLIVSIESVKPMERSIKLPECIAGENSAPPEDCGGPLGYENLKTILNDPKHPEHAETKEWLGLTKKQKWDAEAFDLEKTRALVAKA